MARGFPLLGVWLGCCLCAAAAPPLSYTVIDSQAQNPGLFTQGLEIAGDRLYASSGLYGKSWIAAYKLESGTVVRTQRLPRSLFAEGLTLLQNRLYLLTWKAGRTLVFDPDDFTVLNTFHYTGEGWGLTHDGTHLIMSNGSEQLVWRDPATFEPVRRLRILHGERPRHQLNELEYADGFIWANVWQQDTILKIHPTDGQVVAEADLSRLRRKTVTPDHNNVLNGIAYDPQRQAFWVTGKLWPKRYLVQFTERAPAANPPRQPPAALKPD
ncbi:glutaminyl-peptide cyclotransferase [Exilibacterium tricleocarpae]|uniref:Glutaminyl-peptide cyclotransferase n=1 Tax=Exilibacterium tricleocarpae TaxID=2591008 RepID=A0A545SS22_9GAMM|nr:glutaminyl-peptide cyclotransferase [Exilibacterium tricleocarpae]TQV67769.1 glutaminyl-peptide cyclotransferase [Exilibacterium tricleocarpae]